MKRDKGGTRREYGGGKGGTIRCDRPVVHTALVVLVASTGSHFSYVFVQSKRGWLVSSGGVPWKRNPSMFLRKPKEKREEKPVIQGAFDKTKHPGGCLRAAPVIRLSESRIWSRR